jgi:hypothetical protein
MRRSFLFVPAVLLLSAAPGQAAVWDWIKDLSGPGPSESRGNLLWTFCFGSPLDRRPQDPCLFADGRRFVNESDDNFPNRVRFEAYDFGITWKLWEERIELGGGAGFMRFHSEDRINGGEMTTRKFTLNLPRMVAVPVRIIFPMIPNEGWPRRLSRVLKVYGRFNIIPGRIDATDFGVPLGSGVGQSTFAEENDIVWSNGFILDLGELVWP